MHMRSRTCRAANIEKVPRWVRHGNSVTGRSSDEDFVGALMLVLKSPDSPPGAKVRRQAGRLPRPLSDTANAGPKKTTGNAGQASAIPILYQAHTSHKRSRSGFEESRRGGQIRSSILFFEQLRDAGYQSKRWIRVGSSDRASYPSAR